MDDLYENECIGYFIDFNISPTYFTVTGPGVKSMLTPILSFFFTLNQSLGF